MLRLGEQVDCSAKYQTIISHFKLKEIFLKQKHCSSCILKYLINEYFVMSIVYNFGDQNRRIPGTTASLINKIGQTVFSIAFVPI